MAVKLKVFTFNLRTETTVDGDNIFWNRTGRIQELLAAEKPDLIGFQEVTDKMRDWLRTSLPGYTVLGCGRGKDYRGESMALAYRTDDFELIGLEQFWLSPTPDQPGTRFSGDQSSCPRMVTDVTLKHHDAEELIRFYNTHLDHKGAVARLLGATQLMQAISQWGGKFVLTGDFNALPETVEMQTITSCKYLPIIDATALLGGTFHNFGRKEKPSKIDYIFTNADCDPAESQIIEDIPVNGIYLSDHNPVCAYITIE
ncbi:MAG: endonuclease/exonuclease/phosphatase family protein [Clostridia bacterium]|nr:endonuclease/exonuclease/phosphatase family protein [Clostridia bacterium]